MNLGFSVFLIGSVILIDLTFSGDNALVIGSAAAVVFPDQRRPVLLLGAVGVLGIRFLLIHLVTFILSIPLFKFIGGLLVLFIAVQTLMNMNNKKFLSGPEASAIETLNVWACIKRVRNLTGCIDQPRENRIVPGKRNLIVGVAMVVLADTMTSLDNIVAIAAFTANIRNSDILIVIGLTISKIFLIVSSALIAELIWRLRLLVIIASFLLATIAGELINSVSQQIVGNTSVFFGQWIFPIKYLIYVLCYIVIFFTMLVYLISKKIKSRYASNGSL